MLKLILSILLLFSSGVIGLHLSQRLTRRKDILVGFDVMFHRASMLIEYNAGNLCEVFSDNFADYSFRHNIPFRLQWEEFVRSFTSVLTKEDIAALIDFTKELGTADCESQRRHIALYSNILREHIEIAQKDIQAKSKMYRIIPVSIGMVIALLLI